MRSRSPGRGRLFVNLGNYIGTRRAPEQFRTQPKHYFGSAFLCFVQIGLKGTVFEPMGVFKIILQSFGIRWGQTVAIIVFGALFCFRMVREMLLGLLLAYLGSSVSDGTISLPRMAPGICHMVLQERPWSHPKPSKARFLGLILGLELGMIHRSDFGRGNT